MLPGVMARRPGMEQPLSAGSSTNHDWATRCIHVPDTETTWPPKYSRKLWTEKAENVRRRSAPGEVTPRP